MKDSLMENCVGTLTLWNITCHYSFIDQEVLKISPEEQMAENFAQECRERKGNFDGLDWIYGKGDYNRDFAFLPFEFQGPLSYHNGVLTLGISMYLIGFDFKNDSTYQKDLHGFSAVDFYGEAVNSVFSPQCILMKKSCQDRERVIEWRPASECSRTFETCIDGISCSLIFTVFVDRHDLNRDTNDLGVLRSILRLEFSERQNVSFLPRCRDCVYRFLQFCVSNLDVGGLHICLWNEKSRVGDFEMPGAIDCYSKCDSPGSVQFRNPPYYRFQVNMLGEKTGKVFSLLCDDESSPVLGFLPEKDGDNIVDRNKIRDLCTSFEVEFDYRSSEFSYTEVDELVKELKKTVKEYKKQHPGEIDNDTYSYIGSSLGFISMPAREKVWLLYSRYRTMIDEEFKKVSRGLVRDLDLSEEQTQKNIAWLVKLRNNITHSTGSKENDIPNLIYSRLRVIIYCSILERAGYTLEEIKKILQSYFSGKYE